MALEKLQDKLLEEIDDLIDRIEKGRDLPGHSYTKELELKLKTEYNEFR